MSKTKTSFADLGVSETTLEALRKKGFTHPTAIQEKTIPLLLKGNKDIIGKAQTGTGKTAAFAIPLIERTLAHANYVQALILAPTRELALQVAKEIESLQGDRDIKTLAVYGGANIREQIKQLNQGVQIVVGTPGRVIDLINRNKLKLDNVSYAVLDEADEMLNMGFLEDIEHILAQTNRDKKMLLFSATMPKEIFKIAKTFMREYDVAEVQSKNLTSDQVEQLYYDIRPKDRIRAIHAIIATTTDFHGIIFCNTRATVDSLTQELRNEGYAAAGLHGDISQSDRERILLRFRKRTTNILVATDVAARGIDVNDLTHVINHEIPQSPETYVHRIGRTGRSGKKGIAITFVIPSEKRKLRGVERVVKQQIAKGTLPRAQDIIEIKKQEINQKLEKIMSNDYTKRYRAEIQQLTREQSAEHVIAGLLKYIYGKDIDAGKLNDIPEPEPRAAKPRKDGRNPRYQKHKRGRPSDDRHDERSDRPKGKKYGRGNGKTPKRYANKRYRQR